MKTPNISFGTMCAVDLQLKSRKWNLIQLILSFFALIILCIFLHPSIVKSLKRHGIMVAFVLKHLHIDYFTSPFHTLHIDSKGFN